MIILTFIRLLAEWPIKLSGCHNDRQSLVFLTWRENRKFLSGKSNRLLCVYCNLLHRSCKKIIIINTYSGVRYLLIGLYVNISLWAEWLMKIGEYTTTCPSKIFTFFFFTFFTRIKSQQVLVSLRCRYLIARVLSLTMRKTEWKIKRQTPVFMTIDFVSLL